MNLLRKLLDIFLPEDKKIAKLLKLSPSDLRKLLPVAEGIKDRDTFPIFSYRNKNVQQIIWAIKYRLHPELLRRMAEVLYEEIIELSEEKLLFEGKSEIALIPIPMSNKSRRERGFNQTEELCKLVGEISNGEIKILNLLEKIKETPHQTKLSRGERLENMKDSMRLKIENSKLKMENFFLIIIDDVYTTGATITEARRAMKEVGLKKVFAITLAH